MPSHRHLLRVLVAVAAVAVLTAGGAWLLARSDYAARRVAALVEVAAGRPVTVASLEVTPGRWLHVAVRDLAIADAAGRDAPALLEIGAIRAELPWRTLWSPAAVAGRVEISRVRARITVDRDGQTAWTALLAHVLDWIGPGESRFSVGRLELADGALEFRDLRDGRELRFSGIGLEASDVRPREPFTTAARVAGQAAGWLFHASFQGRVIVDPDANRYAAETLSLKAWVGGEHLPLAGVDARGTVGRAAVDLAAGTAAVDALTLEAAGITLSGRLALTGLADTPAPSRPEATFALATREFAPRMVANALGIELPVTADVSALATASLEARGTFAAERLDIDVPLVRLDATTAHGSLGWTLDGTAPPLLRLEADAIDLDRYLPPADPHAPRTDPAAALGDALERLRHLDLDARIAIGEARLAGARARRMVLTVEPDARGPAKRP